VLVWFGTTRTNGTQGQPDKKARCPFTELELSVRDGDSIYCHNRIADPCGSRDRDRDRDRARSCVIRTRSSLLLSMAGKHRKFGLKPYRVISNEVQALASLYPEFVTVYTAQERFGLSSPGICGDAPCLQWVLQITDKATLDQDIER
jgi:hypothetical protein